MKQHLGGLANRREFIGGGLSLFAGWCLPVRAFSGGTPNLRLGVASDIHISGMWRQDIELEKTLRWFDAEKVDAVMVPGDIAHSGLISELETFASVWNRVFPGDRGGDGRPVEKLFVTGNHDLDAWWVKGDAAKLERTLFSYGDNRRKVWERLFHEEYLPVWKKTVKGYTFVGAQWPKPQPPVEAWFREHAEELRGTKPFFYVQHAHPKGTCHQGRASTDDGTSTRVLSAFPNAVAITGHSHQTLTDESSVWQGAFTSIGAGCLRSACDDRWDFPYDSRWPFYSPKRKMNRMKPLSGEEGRCALLIDVFDDRLVVHRRSVAYGMPLGDDWCVPLPATKGGPFDTEVRKASGAAPEFDAGAKASVERCAVTPDDIAGPALKGKPCVRVRIPPARTVPGGRRVYDYEVKAMDGDTTLLTRYVLAAGFNVPPDKSVRTSDCLFDDVEIPADRPVRFVITPRDSFGIAGASLQSCLSET